MNSETLFDQIKSTFSLLESEIQFIFLQEEQLFCFERNTHAWNDLYCELSSSDAMIKIPAATRLFNKY